jgi:hypothetical protein
MRPKNIAMLIFTVFINASFLASLCTLANAQEPERPILDRTFNAAKETEMQNLKGLAIDKAYRRMQGIDFSKNSDLIHKAVFTAFEKREKKVINYAINFLKMPRIESIDGRIVSRSEDLYIAKNIFEVFPEQSVDELLRLYGNSDPSTKGNIIYAVGKMAGGQAIRNLLIEALDDRTYYDDEETYPEGLSGPPLRICDLAYNQLVLRYRIRNVLRAIGHAYRIDVRDYHINVLKDKLALLP